MVKLAWKVINGYGPYAYLQKSVKYPGGKVVSEHIKYLGNLSKLGANPGGFVMYNGKKINVPKLPAAEFAQLKPGPAKKISPAWLEGTGEPESASPLDTPIEVANQKAGLALYSPPAGMSGAVWEEHIKAIVKTTPQTKDGLAIAWATKEAIKQGDISLAGAEVTKVGADGLEPVAKAVLTAWGAGMAAKKKHVAVTDQIEYSGLLKPPAGVSQGVWLKNVLAIIEAAPSSAHATDAVKAVKDGVEQENFGITAGAAYDKPTSFSDAAQIEFGKAITVAYGQALAEKKKHHADTTPLSVLEAEVKAKKPSIQPEDLYKKKIALTVKGKKVAPKFKGKLPTLNSGKPVLADWHIAQLEEAAKLGVPQLQEKAAELEGKFLATSKKAAVVNVANDLEKQITGVTDMEGADDGAQSETVAAVASGAVKLPEQTEPTSKVLDQQEKAFDSGKKNWGADLQLIEGKKGSNEGGLFKDKKLQTLHYVKWPGEDRARVEVLAGQLYRMAGVPVPVTRYAEIDGKPAVVSDWIAGATPMSVESMKRNPTVLKHFAADAWLANWDVVGLAHDNIVKAPGGSAVRIDPGGSMVFRAQGATKPYPANTVSEWETMRNPATAKQAGAVFAGASAAQLRLGAKKVGQISDTQIDEAVDEQMGKSHHLNAQLKKALKGRRDWLVTEVTKKKAATKKLPFAAVAKMSKVAPNLVESAAQVLAGTDQHVYGSGANKKEYIAAVAGPGHIQNAHTAAEYFDYWKGSTGNPRGNTLRWAAAEFKGKKGATSRANTLKFLRFNREWYIKESGGVPTKAAVAQYVKNEAAKIDDLIAKDGPAIVDGLGTHQRANLAVTALRFHNTDAPKPTKKIPVYRSFRADQMTFMGWKGLKVGDSVELKAPDIASYSFSASVAKNFSSHGGVTVRAEVPIRDFLLTDRASNYTGKSVGEDEVLWIKRPQTVEVINVY